MAFNIIDQFGRAVSRWVSGIIPHFDSAENPAPRAINYDPGAVPAAYACVNLLTNQLCDVPHVIVRADRSDPDYYEVDPGHAMNGLLRRPYAQADTWQWRDWVYRPFVAEGNGYAYIRRESGRAVELIPARVLKAEWIGSGTERRVTRQVQLLGTDGVPTTTLTVGEMDLLAFHGPGFTGLRSPSPIAWAARRTLEMMATAVEHNRDALLSSLAGAYLKADPEIKDFLPGRDDRTKELAALARMIRQGTRDGGLPVLPPGITFGEKAGLSSVDLQLIDVLRWSVEEVCRVWQVPPRMVGHYHAGLRAESRLSTQAEDFERWAVRPRTRPVDYQYTAKILTPEEQAAGLQVRLITDGIRAGSFAERVQTAVTGYTGGLFRRNEARRLPRLPAVEGGDEFIETPRGAGTSSGGAEPTDPGGGNGPPPTE